MRGWGERCWGVAEWGGGGRGGLLKLTDFRIYTNDL